MFSFFNFSFYAKIVIENCGLSLSAGYCNRLEFAKTGSFVSVLVGSGSGVVSLVSSSV